MPPIAHYGDYGGTIEEPMAATVRSLAPVAAQIEFETQVRWPDWMGAVATRVNELAGLGENWDGRGGRRLRIQDARAAIEFLVRFMKPSTPVPWIGLLTTGGIEMSWAASGIELEAVFDSARQEAVVLYEDDDTELELSANDWNVVAGLADRLTPEVPPIPA